jgi:hypothetical protein
MVTYYDSYQKLIVSYNSRNTQVKAMGSKNSVQGDCSETDNQKYLSIEGTALPVLHILNVLCVNITGLHPVTYLKILRSALSVLLIFSWFSGSSG